MTTETEKARQHGIICANRDWEDHGGNQQDSDGNYLMPLSPTDVEIDAMICAPGNAAENVAAFKHAYRETAEELIASA